MSGDPEGWTTASVTVARPGDSDPKPGLVLVYSQLHPHLPSVAPFGFGDTTLGRDGSNTYPIPEVAVSRHHARIERRSDGYWIEDLGSTNGTIVNGVRVKSKRLDAHDVVRVGDTIFRVTANSIRSFGAYRVDGSVIEDRRPFSRPMSRDWIGGFQVDALLDRIDKVARAGLAVVITGESGTGKELAAREVHNSSGRSGPFQAINCAALPATLLESELFGHLRGAFTGATVNKTGLIRAAHLGTLFLDEIGDMALEAQAKLLRVLQEREVLPIGATVTEPVDVRVVCATHRDLDAMVADGTFRGDLLARLREFHVHLPPLRERLEDIYQLARHFRDAAGHPESAFSFGYLLALTHYRWPYNIRELESAVRLSLALAGGRTLELEHLPDAVQAVVETGAAKATSPTTGRGASVGPTEHELRGLLREHSGNLAAVGRATGKKRMQVHRWLKRYGIDPDDYR